MAQNNEKMRTGVRWLGAFLLVGVLVGILAAIARAKTAPAGSWLAARTSVLTLKGLLIGASLAAWYWTQALITSRIRKDDHIGDLLHDLTESWNTWLLAHRRFSSGLLIASSICIDLFGLFLICAGVFGPTLRPLLALVMLFTFRQFCQMVCALPPPPKMIWHHPGFPSLLVTYATANDFFISGHTAIAVLGTIELWHVLPLGFGIAAALVAVFEGAVVIILRAHYTMDVLGAIVAAFCAATLAGQICLATGL